VAVQADGKVLVAGLASFPDYYVGDQVIPPDSRFAVTRYNADGSLDATFGDAGRTLIDFHPLFPLNWVISGGRVQMAVDGQGRILVAGDLDIDATIGVARLDRDGHLDTSFGNGGEKILDNRSTRLGGLVGTAVDDRNGILVVGLDAVAR